ncbi:MAG: ParB/RepB/Spo0J family partition protein [Paracoccaceae bacterium]|nr:ParB/RepB/Spo0J family partition protein [Paracoccaceae bacterium]
MDDKNRKKGLGRGLSTLLAETNNDKGNNLDVSIIDRYLPIEKIEPNLNQPRKKFDKLKLEELSQSIFKNGIIQPVIVRPKGFKYELIAGERRWRAAQLCKIHSIPVIVRDITDEQAAEYAIAENIQREDLTSIEEARSYKNLLDIYSYTQEEVSTALGKSRSYIANMLRLLTLPATVISFLEESKISIGHARALVGLEDPTNTAKKIISRNLSVRETEALVKRIRSNSSLSISTSTKRIKKDIDTLNLEKSLTFQTKFKITINQHIDNKSGKLTFNYNSLEELDRICDFLYKR